MVWFHHLFKPVLCIKFFNSCSRNTILVWNILVSYLNPCIQVFWFIPQWMQDVSSPRRLEGSDATKILRTKSQPFLQLRKRYGAQNSWCVKSQPLFIYSRFRLLFRDFCVVLNKKMEHLNGLGICYYQMWSKIWPFWMIYTLKFEPHFFTDSNFEWYFCQVEGPSIITATDLMWCWL